MGPVSTADFYMRIIRYYQEKFGATYVKDFPPMIIFSVPAPDLVESIENEQEQLNMMIEVARKLENDGCDFIVIVCNSVQYLLPEIQAAVTAPCVGIADTVAKYLKNKGYKSVGILATDTTIKKGVYDKAINNVDVQLVRPNSFDQKDVTQVILNEIGGKATDQDTNKLKTVVNNLQKEDVSAVLLACTELPSVIQQDKVSTPLIDCNSIYAEAAAELAST